MAGDPEDQVRDFLEVGLANDRAQELRARIAHDIPALLAENGFRLSVHHQLTGDSAGLGFAIAVEMTGELGEGARQLFDADLWYPGAALVRQLLECQYLLALARDDRTEPERWLKSSRKEILSRFMPSHMRRRSAQGFQVAEYQVHCDWGGHPNPKGRDLLRRHEEWRPVSPRWLWLDLAQHLAESWHYFNGALPLYDPRMDPRNPKHDPDRSPDGKQGAADLLTEWREHDPLADRLPQPPD
jgi:hypothetical protein